jgi:ribosomal protein S1
VEDPHELIAEGETHLLRVVSLDTNRQRIGLSLKNVTAAEQIAWMAQKEAEATEAAEVSEIEDETSVADEEE